MRVKTTIYTHPAALLHDTGDGHPEGAARLHALETILKEYPQIEAQPATQDQLLRAHPLHHIQMIEEATPPSGLSALDGDTILSPHSFDAALLAAGAACQAVDDVIAGRTQAAFCAMRPPGHHAEPTRAMGFCLFNNVFIAARHAQAAHNIKKIAIVDFDVHHGNGTDTMTRRHDGSILYISTHQYPLWPMSGLEEDNEDSVKNFTLPAGADGDTFRKLYETKVFPALNKFAPDLLMISAGFDGHRDDPLAGWTLTEQDFGWVTAELKKIAVTHGHGRVISMLEGGYHLPALAASVAAHLRALNA
jgi:acetoin utilization deacetylase AcuC-like enzyme